MSEQFYNFDFKFVNIDSISRYVSQTFNVYPFKTRNNTNDIIANQSNELIKYALGYCCYIQEEEARSKLYKLFLENFKIEFGSYEYITMFSMQSDTHKALKMLAYTLINSGNNLTKQKVKDTLNNMNYDILDALKCLILYEKVGFGMPTHYYKNIYILPELHHKPDLLNAINENALDRFCKQYNLESQKIELLQKYSSN